MSITTDARRPAESIATSGSRPRVLLIVGSGRSGSTLLERALGEVPWVTGLGEMVHLWDRAVRDDELCACGRRFSGCDFWQSVGARAFGGWGRGDPTRLIAARHAVVRTRRLPALLSTHPSAPWREQRDRLVEATQAVLAAAMAESGARLVVDSSKIPAYAALLGRADVDLHCLQVVRDPRGVAHSLAKTVARPEVTEGTDLMHRTGAVESALWWSAFDVVGAALRARPGTSWSTVRYEDFVADPRSTVARVLDEAGHPATPADLAHVHGDRLQLGTTHQVAGNPVRFRSGEVTVRGDEAWRSTLPVRDRRVVEALTVGLRHRHGYR